MNEHPKVEKPVRARDIKQLLRAKGWVVGSWTSGTGSKYYNGIQGHKRVVIRVSDHKQGKKTQAKHPAKNRPTFDFYPGSPDTLAELRLYLDDPTRR